MNLNKFKMLGVAAVLVAAGMNVSHAAEPQQQVQQEEKLTIFNIMKKVLKTEDNKAQQNINNETQELMNRKATHTYETGKYGTPINGSEPGSVLLTPNEVMNAEKQELMNRKATHTYQTGKYGNTSSVDNRMSNEDILIASTKAFEQSKNIEKGNVLLKPNENPKPPEIANTSSEPEVKPGDILMKAWEGTKNVASTVAEKSKESIMSTKAKIDAQNQRKQEKPMVVEARGPNLGQVTTQDVIKAKDKVLDGVTSLLGKFRSQPKKEETNKITP